MWVGRQPPKLAASTFTVTEYYNQKTEAESFSETLAHS